MNNFTDKEITNVLLDNHKLSATSLTNLILESSNQQLRNDASSILDKTFQHQKQIFDVMSQKGFYQVQQATAQDVSKVQQQFNASASNTTATGTSSTGSNTVGSNATGSSTSGNTNRTM
jgi:spore coat protein F